MNTVTQQLKDLIETSCMLSEHLYNDSLNFPENVLVIKYMHFREVCCINDNLCLVTFGGEVLNNIDAIPERIWKGIINAELNKREFSNITQLLLIEAIERHGVLYQLSHNTQSEIELALAKRGYSITLDIANDIECVIHRNLDNCEIELLQPRVLSIIKKYLSVE